MSKLPVGWELVTLESISRKMQSGGTPLSSNKSFYNGDIPFVKIDDITSSTKYLYKTKINITKEGLENSSAWIVPINSILYSMYASLGFLVINKIPVATNQAIMNIIPDSDKVELEYLYQFLIDFKNKINKFIDQTTQKNLNAQKVKNFLINLPPLEEQKKIADILSTVDEKIAFVEDSINQTEELKKALMQKLLTEGIGHTEFKDSELGKIPKSWEVKKLGNIGSLENGYAFKSKEYNIEKKGYQVIRMSNINTFGLNLKKDPKYLENIEEKAKKYILKMEDILITLTGTIGKTDYGHVAFINTNAPMVLNQRVGRFVPKKYNYNKFFFYVFNFSLFRNKFFEFGKGGTGNQANVGKNDFETIEIIVPTFEEQKQIAEILSTVDNKLEVLRDKKEHFEELKKGLMQKLLTGEIRV